MTGSCVSSGNGKVLAPILFGVLALGLMAPLSHAEERAFVTPDGKRIPLVRSQNELAVSFDGLGSVERSAKSLAAKGIGVVEDVPGAARARHKLLRVADTGAARRSLARTEPGIREIRPVYYMEGVKSPFFSSGAIVLKLSPSVTDEQRESLWTDYRVEVMREVEGLEGVYRVKPLDDEEDEVLRAQALAVDARTVWAQPDFRHRLLTKQVQPRDEFFDRQWHLDNTGQAGGKSGADISALDAWTLAQGSDVLIGMFDDACDINHQDLFENYSGTGQDPGTEATGFSEPLPGQFGDRHGTAVMGLAVAKDNAVGGRGVSYFSKFTVSRGLSEMLTFSEISIVYTFARQQDVDVHINSWGFEGDTVPAIVVDAIGTAFNQGRDPDGEEGDSPPLGMVLVFAAGNGMEGSDVGVELESGDDLSTLDTVIGVGATTNQDVLADYSNYGNDIDLVAPGGDEVAALITTDNDDELVFVDDGFNIGGFTSLNAPDLDSAGRYTETFAGTSAACPVVAGVAGLMLSANPLLTATDTRIILEHTTDQINPEDAEYSNVSGRSLRYGYGRVNAATAVAAAIEARPTNLGQNWPDRAANVELESTTLTWRAGRGTREFLVVESPGGFSFVNEGETAFPIDGVCYSVDQVGCAGRSEEELGVLPAGVTLTEIISCDGNCATNTDFTIEDLLPEGISYAVYGRSSIARHAWGVEATVIEPDTGGGGTTTVTGPKVLIQASPIEGPSPLLVTFDANAVRTSADIDDSRTVWDFDIDDDISRDATTRHATHAYEVPANVTRTFIARLTMYDVDGNPGVAQVTIRVEGDSNSTNSTGDGQSDIRLLVGIPGSADSDVDQGQSPFDVLLSVDATTLGGTLQSVAWDLGDGTTANSLVVPHTFINMTGQSLRIPIVAAVTIRTSPLTTQTLTATRVITVFPGAFVEDRPDATLDGAGVMPGSGGTTGTCGVLGMLPLMLMFSAPVWMRRRS